jgi:hypothetical protein
MIRQARTGDIVLDKTREMTGRTQTLSCWLEVDGVKTTENKIHWPVGGGCGCLTTEGRGESALIDVLPSLAGREGWGRHDLYCDGS